MKQFYWFLVWMTALTVPALPQKTANPFAGRWDITVVSTAATYPDWLEVTEKDGALAARIQPRGGSVRPASAVKAEGSRLFLTQTQASGGTPATTWELALSGDRIKGTQKRGVEVTGELTGVRAPELKRKAPRSWSDPEPLFNGRDLTGWEPIPPAANHWVARDGELLNESKGANLRTVDKFEDFKLHIELNCPENGNSGVYLRGRYEVQIEYEPAGSEDGFHSMASIYGFVAPTVQMPRKPGQWESLDITLVGRVVTIVRDGTTIIDHQEIAGITGGALDSNEGEPGPFYIQGDHTGGMKYRNITVSVPKR